MVYRIEEGPSNSILAFNIIVEDFSYLMGEDYYLLMEKIVREDQLLKLINFPDEIINLIIDTIINDKDIRYLNEILIQNKVPLYSLILNLVNTYKRKYERLIALKQESCIEIVCNKYNLIKGLELAKKLGKRTVINGTGISLSDYQEILSKYNIDSLKNYNIKVYYQEQNDKIEVSKLYETSLVVDNIAKEIRKYNLSAFETIIYAYDIVKARAYEESEENKLASRSLDQMLFGKYTVCVGFSNFLVAILRSLGINAMPLISIEKKHQLCLIYIKDSKYHIDGVYVFDPTGDHKVSDDYIDNYKYFAMPISSFNNIYPDKNTDIFSMSFNDVLNLYRTADKNKYMDNMDIMDEIEELFNLAQIEGYEEFKEITSHFKYETIANRDKALSTYQSYITKYNRGEISPKTFMIALVKTRLIEYYNKVIEGFSIDSVKEATRKRYTFQRLVAEKDREVLGRILDLLDYNLELEDSLEELSSQMEEDTEREHLNIRLLKTLRNIKK